MAKDFSHPKVVESYDEHIRKLIPGYELVHLQIQAILKSRLNIPAKILIAGCGTGFELDYLTQQFPQADFVAFDPSWEMIQKAKKRINDPQCLNRIEFIHGDSAVLTEYEDQFDVVLLILVSHFLDKVSKTQIINDLLKSLKRGGMYLSFDLMAFKYDQQVQQLQYMTQALGLSEKQSQAMVERLEGDFHLISIDQMHQLLKSTGFSKIENFTQILNFFGICALKAPLLNQDIK